jgi:DNA primase
MLPPGKDPDDLVREGGAEAFENAIAEPVPLDVLLYQEARSAADMDRPEARAGLRQTLQELAASCGDRLVADEYRRSLTSLFFEDFGWKKAERRAIASGVLRAAAPTLGRPLRDVFIEAMLYGLSRQPKLVVEHIEQIGSLSTDDGKLQRWLHALVDAGWRNPALDSDAIPSILEAALLPEALQFNLQKQLRFPFLDADIGSERAVQQLSGLIDILCGERELGEQLEMLNAEAKGAVADGSEDRYGHVESERAEVRRQQQLLLENAFGLGEQI